jgi:hypothetical protein
VGTFTHQEAEIESCLQFAGLIDKQQQVYRNAGLLKLFNILVGGHAFIIYINVNNITSFHVGLGHKGPVLRPRCIGPERLEPKYYSVLQVG